MVHDVDSKISKVLAVLASVAIARYGCSSTCCIPAKSELEERMTHMEARIAVLENMLKFKPKPHQDKSCNLLE